jgi:hypothetical protein
MKHFSLLVLALTAVLSTTPAARADRFSYSFDGSGFDASLTFTASQVKNDPGVYQISNVAGTIYTAGVDIKSPVSFSTAAYTDPNGIAPNTEYFPTVGFIYDNLLTPGASQVFDFQGVLFEADGLYFNLFSNNGAYQWADTGSYTNTSNVAYPMTDPPASETSEPGSLLLFGTGLLVLAGFVFRRARQSAAASKVTQ